MVSRVISLHFFALALVLIAAPSAASLRALAPVSLEPGDLLEQAIDWQASDGVRIEIVLTSAPDNARLKVTDEGSLILHWQTGPDLPDETLVTILARNVDTQAQLGSTVLSVQNQALSRMPPPAAAPAPAPAPALASATAPVSDLQPAPTERPTIYLAPLSGQIVSAGRTVSFSLVAQSSDDESPLFSFDRLPRNASLEENSQGVHTFFWQTSDRDQGEHVFRVTAYHPTDPSIWSSRQMTIVVGDPSRGRTLPVIQ